jgi:DNA repair protein RecO (recombination protein O)
MVFLRKSSGGLDLLTEAQVVQRFAQLRSDLPALYTAYYMAELLSDWTEEYDPHPVLFDEALATLRALGQATPLRLARFELVLLRELGYRPALDHCAGCEEPVTGAELAFSAAAGGVLCPKCQPQQRDRRPVSPEAWNLLRALGDSTEPWRQAWSSAARQETRRLLNQYVTWLRGRPPRLLPYLGS